MIDPYNANVAPIPNLRIEQDLKEPYYDKGSNTVYSPPGLERDFLVLLKDFDDMADLRDFLARHRELHNEWNHL